VIHNEHSGDMSEEIEESYDDSSDAEVQKNLPPESQTQSETEKKEKTIEGS